MEKTISIVIADDNKDFCSILQEYLDENTEIKVVGIANDGLETVETVKQQKPDLLVLDMVMPNLDGIGVLERINAGSFYRRPGIIVLTSLGKDIYIQNALELGADYYIIKPFGLDLLVERIVSLAKSIRKNTMIEPRPCVLSEKSSVEHRITKLMLDIGMPANIKGYHYIRDSIMIVLNDTETKCAMTKIVYPTIAKQYASTPARVERAIRHAIEVAWERGKAVVLEDLFGFTVDLNKGKPTNSEFITLIADKIKMQNDFYR